MSDSLSKVYDDFDVYITLCNKLREESKPLKPNSGWYKHFRELENKLKDKKL